MRTRKEEIVIACGVFRPCMRHMKITERFPRLRLRFLPSNLHINPFILQRRVLKEIRAAKRRNERITCLYGECFPGIDDFCAEHGARRVPGCNCYQMLLGRDLFHRLIDETAGTYFLEQELITDFERCCAQPLELHDEEMRQEFFKHYRKLVYVRQPGDRGLEFKAQELARFLDLCLDIRDSDYSHLERRLLALIE
ncbi:MAG: DUF1638 domain-containing protein, partial [Desulfomonilaceae bacterium]|nr:DUF1638 domain-containing protein [Desulfomonilaceae bacterium]